MFIDDIFHKPPPCFGDSCNDKFRFTPHTSDIPWLPLPIFSLPLHVLLFTATFTTTDKFPQNYLLVRFISLNIAFSHTKAFLKSILVIELKTFILAMKHPADNVYVHIQTVSTYIGHLFLHITYKLTTGPNHAPEVKEFPCSHIPLKIKGSEIQKFHHGLFCSG